MHTLSAANQHSIQPAAFCFPNDCMCMHTQNTIGIRSQSQTQARRCSSHQKQSAAKPGSDTGLGTSVAAPYCSSSVSPSCSAAQLTVAPQHAPCLSHPTSGLRFLTSSPSGMGCPALVTQPYTDAETPSTAQPRVLESHQTHS